MATVNDIYAFLNDLAPVRYQMDFDNAGFLKFSFEFFECFFDVFAFFYRYYYHIFCLLMFPSTNCGAKLKHCFLINKPFTDIFLSKRVFLHYQA